MSALPTSRDDASPLGARAGLRVALPIVVGLAWLGLRRFRKRLAAVH